MARWLATQPFNRPGTDKTVKITSLRRVERMFRGARPLDDA